ncbi:MAG: nucleoside monophosphate kinase [Bacilli bacterium]|nr:nucleoside monophosphate kinase [Bacilli bacterium]
MINFVFIAPPAAGKGTQSKLLVDKYGYNHISTGDLLREEVATKTTLGIQINEIMSSGKLVDDNIVLTLLKNKLSSVLSENKPFIIDGFPRTPNQAEMLTNCFNELNVDNYKVIYMDLDYEEAKKRVLGRLVCSGCGKSYNDMVESLMPKKSGICDSCSSVLSKRSDDTEETFKDRFDTYINNVKPILNYYNDLNKLINIDASKDAEDIFKDIETYVTEVR